MCFKLAWPRECSPWKRPDTVTFGLGTWYPRVPHKASLLFSPFFPFSTLPAWAQWAPPGASDSPLGPYFPERPGKSKGRLFGALPRALPLRSLAEAWHSANGHRIASPSVSSSTVALPPRWNWMTMTFKLSSVHSSSPSFTACLWHYNVSPLARLNGLGCIFGFLALSFCAYGSCCIPPVRLIRWYSSLSFFFPLCTTGRIVHWFHLYSCPLSFAFGTCSPESPVFPCHDLTSLKRRGRSRLVFTSGFRLAVWWCG